MRKIITPDKRSAFQFSFHPGMRMLRTLFGLFRFYKLKANKNLSLLLTSSVEGLVKKWVLKDSSIIRALSYRQYMEHQRKRKRLEDLQGEKKSIFFVFRDLHILDWFTPVHRALSEEFKGKYEVIYVDFGSTLKQIGRGFEYFSYKSNVEERLLKSGITEPLHFSDQEIGLFPNFPEPDMIVTSETIKHENFSCQERVYIPHYCVPKQKDVTPVKICFNHLFLAVRPPFCYNEILDNTPISAKIHDVGYPKMHAKVELEVKLFNSGNPVVIFAPSVETTIIMDALRKGILQIFSKMTDLNFIIKLHPTLSADMFDLGQYVQKEIGSAANIMLDTRNSLQSICSDASLLISDFGSAGAEYRLSFGKRLIYIDVPDYLHGGADLRFRDAFADGRSNVDDLDKVIRRVLKMGDLNPQEWKEMCEKTLFSYGSADQVAARTIDKILNEQ